MILLTEPLHSANIISLKSERLRRNSTLSPGKQSGPDRQARGRNDRKKIHDFKRLYHHPAVIQASHESLCNRLKELGAEFGTNQVFSGAAPTNGESA
jgi:hypothetical protein